MYHTYNHPLLLNASLLSPLLARSAYGSSWMRPRSSRTSQTLPRTYRVVCACGTCEERGSTR